MANPINLTLMNYQNQLINQSQNQRSANFKPNAASNSSAASALPQLNNYNLNISNAGLQALQNQESTADIDTGNLNKELSPKAQAYLEKLREKYGDYDFFVADNADDVQSLTSQSDKKYSVVLSSDELERMADDEDYANEVMGKVEDAVKTADSVIEKAGLEGVQISQLTISFDENGNTKFSATLEKLSESQQERLDAAKERAAEETEDEIEPARVTIEADDEESFLDQLLQIDWESIYNA